jgi:hypothetical protein
MTDPTEPDDAKYEVMVVQSASMFVDADDRTEAREKANELLFEGIDLTFGEPTVSSVLEPMTES